MYGTKPDLRIARKLYSPARSLQVADAIGSFNNKRGMTRAEKDIYAFLDDHLGIYDNPHGIEFIMNMDDSVFVIHGLNPPPEPYADFGLLYPSAAFNTFVKDFKFANSRALATLTPGHLWQMYYEGKAEIYCTLVVKIIFYALYFRLTGHNTMIVRDENDQEHEIGEVFTSPHQFLEYTQSHFLQDEG
ncbi:hypothetical protein [Longitalea arenae]|uniref:hypothetical protein n=1 Tax=Longitalea arenae TaxID=2812558 RepID=UPI0019681D18|nr:hypothetical protein [Longitalea arenae]